MPRATLKANERIKKNQEITTLIRTGQAFFSAPYKVYYHWQPANDAPIRVAFSVPKKRLQKAVHRNRVKRLSKEAFRLNKGKLVALCEKRNLQLNILFVYQQTALTTLNSSIAAMQHSISQILKHNG